MNTEFVIPLMSLIAGLALLFIGAELLVRGSTGIASRLGLSPLVIGLTVVAYGTSAPELAVSISAAWLDNTDIAVGNVVGSNIANIGLILGLSAIITPIAFDTKLLRIDVPLMMLASAMVAWFLSDGTLSTMEGVLLVAGVIAFTTYTVVDGRKARDQVQDHAQEFLPPMAGRMALDIAMVVIGIVTLAYGGSVLTDAAVHLAELVQISEAVIGLTIVAVGTSLPELATSMLAAARKMGDLAAGNIIGSNIFNLLAVLGMSSMVEPLPLGAVTWIDIGVMLAFTLLVAPLGWSRGSFNRMEGALLFSGWCGYVWWAISF